MSRMSKMSGGKIGLQSRHGCLVNFGSLRKLWTLEGRFEVSVRERNDLG
jgi:hypothetical protein